MISKSSISVVIQGPIDNRTYEAINFYQDFGEVIISNWHDEDLKLLDRAFGEYKLVQSDYASLDNINNYNLFLAQTTLAGAKIATNKYVLKTRSDELYPNLDKLIYNLNLFPKKSHTTNNGFWKHIPHCYSNHLFIDAKEYLITAMQLIIDMYIKNRKSNFQCSESEFGYFLMKARGYDLTDENWKNVFRENVHITPCAELHGHLHSGQSSSGRGFKRSQDPYPNGRMECKSRKHEILQLYNNSEEIV
jgi:hypothetical protein